CIQERASSPRSKKKGENQETSGEQTADGDPKNEIFHCDHVADQLSSVRRISARNSYSIAPIGPAEASRAPARSTSDSLTRKGCRSRKHPPGGTGWSSRRPSRYARRFVGLNDLNALWLRPYAAPLLRMTRPTLESAS